MRWNGRQLATVATETKPLELLKGIDDQKRALLDNTAKFAGGEVALNAFLWGARGMGKSTLIKSVVAEFADLRLIGVDRAGLATLPRLYQILGGKRRRFIVFLDELVFAEDEDFHSFKSLMEGGVVSLPDNIRFYVTSNHRRITIGFGGESGIDDMDDKTALADRFGLRLGFHHCTQELWREMVKTHVLALGKKFNGDDCLKLAERWSIGYGGKSGRAAELFAVSL